MRPGAAGRQLADLAALGLDWDGEVVGQSARGDLYAAALERARGGRSRSTRASARGPTSGPPRPPRTASRATATRAPAARSRRPRRRRAWLPGEAALRFRAEAVIFVDAVHGPVRRS